MTTIAMLDTPECLDLEVASLAAPSVLRQPHAAPERHWTVLKPTGGTQAFRDRAVRECMDTVALLRAYREPLPNETWTLPLASERRLLAQVNAAVALGRAALTQVVDLALDADLPDPGRVFAALFILGCVDGAAWHGPMLAVFTTAVRRNPAEGAAAIEALSLAPNTGLLAGLSKLLRDESAQVRAASVRALSFRAALAWPAWSAAIRDDEAAVVLAAACAPLAGFDRADCARAIEPLLHSGSERLTRAALHAGFSLRLLTAHRRAGEIARSDPTWAGALQCACLFGLREDESLVRAVLAGAQWAAGVRAAALLGRVALVPDLLALTQQAELTAESTPTLREELGTALTTITGLPFGLAADDAAAQTLWAQNASRFHADQRYRHGQPFHPAVLVQSLQTPEHWAAGHRAHWRDARQLTYLELASLTGWRVPRFNAYDFVATQSASLDRVARWVAEFAASPWSAGALH